MYIQICRSLRQKCSNGPSSESELLCLAHPIIAYRHRRTGHASNGRAAETPPSHKNSRMRKRTHGTHNKAEAGMAIRTVVRISCIYMLSLIHPSAPHG